MNTSYTPVAKIWDVSMRLSGLKRGLIHFVSRINIPLPTQASILDLGCGTGVVSFAFVTQYPTAHVIATDADPVMLNEAKKIRERLPLPQQNRITFAQADISNPSTLTIYDSESVTISSPYDLIITSAVLEHATSLPTTMQAIYQMLKPDGRLLAINMASNIVGSFYGKVYNFPIISPGQFETVCVRAGFRSIQPTPLTMSEFPTNLTRSAYLVTK